METQRLKLRPPKLEDAPFFLELLNMPKWLKYIGDRNIHSIADAENYLETRVLKQYQNYGYGAYIVTIKETGEIVGNVGLYNRPGLTHADIGFAFLPQHEGNGYGYESANYLLKLAFTKFELEEVQAITSKQNIASQKLIEKLGLTFQNYVTLPNENEELMLYSIKAT